MLRYAAIAEAEVQSLSARRGEEVVACDLHRKHLSTARRLGLFALHLEHETRGKIMLKRLPQSHPQYQRCRRAATENVKSDFFAANKQTNGRYTGVTVLDVYKIENRLLLKDFQNTSATSEPSKVKGLFCRVPRKCVERLVVHGAHQRPPPLLQNAFQHSWVDATEGEPITGGGVDEEEGTHGGSSDGGGGSGGNMSMEGYAARAVRRSPCLPFPRNFSRHSTLEEDRPAVNGLSRKKEIEQMMQEMAQRHEEPGDKWLGLQQELARAKADMEAEGLGDGVEPGSGTRFLALCRVMIGKIFVASKSQETSPFLAAPDGQLADFDSIYSPTREEYRLLNPTNVLPEFLVEYRFTEELPLPPGFESGQTRSNDAPGDEAKPTPDLTTPFLRLPSYYCEAQSTDVEDHPFSIFPKALVPEPSAHMEPHSSSPLSLPPPPPATSDSNIHSPQFQTRVFLGPRMLQEREAKSQLAAHQAQMEAQRLALRSQRNQSSGWSATGMAQGGTGDPLGDLWGQIRHNSALQRQSLSKAAHVAFDLYWKERDREKRLEAKRMLSQDDAARSGRDRPSSAATHRPSSITVPPSAPNNSSSYTYTGH